MLQHADEHGGYAVDGGTALILQDLHLAQGIVVIHQNDGGAMRQAAHHAQHAAEAVEQGHYDEQTVLLGQLHAVAQKLTVVGNVVVGEHHALGEARGAAGVLHVNRLVGIKARDAFLHHAFRHGLGGLVKVVKAAHAHGPALAVADEQHAFEEGQLLAGDIVRLLGVEGGHEAGDMADVVVVLDTGGHHEHLGIALVEQIVELELLVVGVDGDQNRAQLGRGKHGQHPFGRIGRPDGHMVALANAHGIHAARHLAGAAIKLLPAPAHAKFGRDDAVVVRQSLRVPPKQSGQSVLVQVQRRYKSHASSSSFVFGGAIKKPSSSQ